MFFFLSSLQPSIPRDSLIKPTDTTHDTLDKKHNDIENPAATAVDSDILESVSKLESDIMKTVENNNNKLKELEHLLNEEKKAKQLISKVIEDDVLPIVEETIISHEIVESVTKPESVEKVDEDFVVEDVSLLKKLIAETGNKEDINVETIDGNEPAVVETIVVTPVDVMTTEPPLVETTTEHIIQTTTVALVTDLITPIKVRLFEREVSPFLGINIVDIIVN